MPHSMIRNREVNFDLAHYDRPMLWLSVTEDGTCLAEAEAPAWQMRTFQKCPAARNEGYMMLVMFLSAVAAAIYSGVIFPILVMVDCCSSGRLTPPKRIGWFMAILMSWPLGATLYGFAVSGRPLFKYSILPGLFALGIFHWITVSGGLD